MPAALALLAALLLAGAPAQGRDEPAPPADSFRPDPAWKPLGNAIWFDPAAKKLILRARVSLTEGPLEHLLCRKGTKEHEAILSTEAPPRTIHAGLLLTGATPDHPVRFDPKYEPPAGTPLAIELEWEDGGKAHRIDAREWIKDQANGKGLDRDWVFAGSELFQDPQTKAMLYAADDGDLITVANFPSSIIDLPFRSSANDADRAFVAFTERIPPRGTPVTMTFRPRAAAKAATPKPAAPKPAPAR
ncbi:YdjY domain-containing protein [Tundrisphaera sp. TA3]|uniref:YdjY domain-containing protein n=1 Tax=Tundrisphaera sp. TA3 TaxID=3435775 RepID=UPI003EC0FD05